jgi:hypothetical protein
MKKYLVLTLLVCVVLIGTARITSAANSQVDVSVSSSITAVWDWVTNLFASPKDTPETIGNKSGERDNPKPTPCVASTCGPCVNPETGLPIDCKV